MFEDLTPKLRQAIVLAQDESRLLGHAHIGTEHFLLAFFRIDDCAARSTLEKLGVKREPVAKKVSELVEPGTLSLTERRHIPFTEHATRAIEGARSEATLLAQPIAGTDLFLLAISNQDGSRGALILRELISDQTLLRSTVLAQLGTIDEAVSMPDSDHAGPVAVLHSTDHDIGTLDDPHCPHCGASLKETLRGVIVHVDRTLGVQQLSKIRPRIPPEWLPVILPLDSDRWQSQADLIREMLEKRDLDETIREQAVSDLRKQAGGNPVVVRMAFCRGCGYGLAWILEEGGSSS